MDRNVHRRRCLRLCLLARRCRVRPLMHRETDYYPWLYSILVHPSARQISQLLEHHPVHQAEPCSKPASFAGWLFLLKLIDSEDPVSQHASVCMMLCPLQGAKRYFVAIMQLVVQNCNMPKGRNPSKAALLLPFRCHKMIGHRTLPDRTQSQNDLL